MTSPTSESGADAGIALVTGSPETPDANRTRGAVALTRMKESKPRTRIAAGVGAVLLLAAGGLFYGSTASSAQSQYRLVAVSKGAVTESMILSATLRPVSEAAVAFPTSGTVKSVRVKPGEVVSAGEKLASLDAEELKAKVTSAKKSLADAELALYQLENPSTGSNTSGTSNSATPATSARAAKKAKGTNTKVARLQRAIAETNGALAAALKASESSSAALTAACESTDDAIAQDTSTHSECQAAIREALRMQREVTNLQEQQSKQL
ncbi:MAG: biotin/lipoyl-binding protein, partial [Candidatus Nanopelagicales bacterium]